MYLWLLFGVGYSRFIDYHDRVAHDSSIHTFAELGLLAAFFEVGLVYWYFRGLRAGEAGVPAARLARALTLSGIGFFTMVSFLSRQYDPVSTRDHGPLATSAYSPTPLATLRTVRT